MSSDTPYEFAKTIHERLHGLEEIEADGLAELFGLAVSGTGAKRRALLNTLHHYLLLVTLRHARSHSQYYRNNSVYDFFPETKPGQRPDISPWPILDRSVIKQDFNAYLADNVEPALICHTSGSTGEAFDIYKSTNEIEFLESYFSHRFEPLLRAEILRPITLSFSNLFHGTPLPLPGYSFVLNAGVNDDTLLKDALRVLDKEYEIAGCEKRVSNITGLAFHVMFFTSYLIEKGIDPKSFNIKSLGITGRYTSQHWRSFLSNAWDAEVYDRLSMTEILGGATRLGNSDIFVVDPHVFPELVEPNGDAEPDSRIGSLVYSNLYPFVQQQPLLRYRTGDLIRCLKKVPFMFEYLGREKNCVGYDDGTTYRWLLFSAPLNEILSPLPDIGMYEIFGAVNIVRDRSVGALPLINIHWKEDKALCIKIELKYSPHLYPERIAYLREHIGIKLRKVRDTCLDEDLESGRVQLIIDFVGPGCLANDKTLKI